VRTRGSGGFFASGDSQAHALKRVDLPMIPNVPVVRLGQVDAFLRVGRTSGYPRAMTVPAPSEPVPADPAPQPLDPGVPGRPPDPVD
jgi:hypothetical protein